MVYTGSQGGIEALFIEAEAVVCGKLRCIVIQPGILLLPSSIHPSDTTHTDLSGIFQLQPICVSALKHLHTDLFLKSKSNVEI